MIRKKELFKIGILNKPHGIHGELSFTFTDDIFDRTEEKYLICLLDGIFVPFFMEEYRFKSDSTALVRFEDIDSAEKAKKLTNTEVYYPVKFAVDRSPEELSWEYFNGFHVSETNFGELGEIVDVDTSTINTLFVIDYKGEELLIPAREEFIVAIDQDKRNIVFDLPEGLLDMEHAESAD